MTAIQTSELCCDQRIVFRKFGSPRSRTQGLQDDHVIGGRSRCLIDQRVRQIVFKGSNCPKNSGVECWIFRMRKLPQRHDKEMMLWGGIPINVKAEPLVLECRSNQELL